MNVLFVLVLIVAIGTQQIVGQVSNARSLFDHFFVSNEKSTRSATVGGPYNATILGGDSVGDLVYLNNGNNDYMFGGEQNAGTTVLGSQILKIDEQATNSSTPGTWDVEVVFFTNDGSDFLPVGVTYMGNNITDLYLLIGPSNIIPTFLPVPYTAVTSWTITSISAAYFVNGNVFASGDFAPVQNPNGLEFSINLNNCAGFGINALGIAWTVQEVPLTTSPLTTSVTTAALSTGALTTSQPVTTDSLTTALTTAALTTALTTAALTTALTTSQSSTTHSLTTALTTAALTTSQAGITTHSLTSLTTSQAVITTHSLTSQPLTTSKVTTGLTTTSGSEATTSSPVSDAISLNVTLTSVILLFASILYLQIL